ncbi:MAG: retroviral-like aspartic protease family protein [Nanoarchaeota archaeon]|nr:retroviral-like aspartic protease family protein [Nanoarchaeota archaeon]
MKSIFPYQKINNKYYPIIKLAVIFGNKKIIIEALVDSGANVSIFNEDIANILGIKIENGKQIYLGGVGGRIMGYAHILQIETALDFGTFVKNT